MKWWLIPAIFWCSWVWLMLILAAGNLVIPS